MNKFIFQLHVPKIQIYYLCYRYGPWYTYYMYRFAEQTRRGGSERLMGARLSCYVVAYSTDPCVYKCRSVGSSASGTAENP